MQLLTSDVGSVITARQIEATPLNGRDILQLATLAPGVNTFYSTQTSLEIGAQNFQGSNFLGGSQNVGSDITVGTQREISTGYRLDGINITSPLVGQITLLPSPDGVQEFKAEMSTSPASFDLPQTINVITKSGTNKFHGSTYEYFRNDVLDTRNYFQLPGQTAALRYNQFGATFGGPIKKDKAFFFLIYDGMRSRQPEEDYTTVPTAAELSGNFNYAGAPTIYNFNPQDPYASQPFLNNTIPSNMISSFAKTFNQFIPAPNFVGVGSLAAYNYSTVLSNPYNSDGGSGRLDYAFRSLLKLVPLPRQV
jgi:hypothetical protein